VAGRVSSLYKTEWWGAGVVICLKQGADLHTAQLMPLPLQFCFNKIQTGFTFLVPAHPSSPGQRAIKWVSVAYEQSITKLQSLHAKHNITRTVFFLQGDNRWFTVNC